MRYRVVETPEDEVAVKKLLAAEGLPDQDVAFPTIMAMDDDGLAGFIATTPRSDMVLAGPLVLRPGRTAPLVAAQLARLYETAMRNLGVKSFVFYTDENDSPVGRGMARLYSHVQPYAKVGSQMFYHWHLDDRRRA